MTDLTPDDIARLTAERAEAKNFAELRDKWLTEIAEQTAIDPLIAAQSRLAKLEGALRKARGVCAGASGENPRYVYAPSEGLLREIDAALASATPPAPDPRDAVVEAAIEVRQARKQHSAARLSVTGELKAANDRVCAAERSLEAAVDRHIKRDLELAIG